LKASSPCRVVLSASHSVICGLSVINAGGRCLTIVESQYDSAIAAGACVTDSTQDVCVFAPRVLHPTIECAIDVGLTATYVTLIIPPKTGRSPFGWIGSTGRLFLTFAELQDELLILDVVDHTGDPSVSCRDAGATASSDSIFVPLLNDGVILTAHATSIIPEFRLGTTLAGAHTDENEKKR